MKKTVTVSLSDKDYDILDKSAKLMKRDIESVVSALVSFVVLAAADEQGIKLARERSNRNRLESTQAQMYEQLTRSVPKALQTLIRHRKFGYVVKSSSVYFIQNTVNRHIKIGFSTNVRDRLQSLQTSTPDLLVLLARIDGTIDDEHVYHARFAEYRLTGEWFKECPDILNEIARIQNEEGDDE